MTTATQDEATKSNTNASEQAAKPAEPKTAKSSGWKTASVFLVGVATGAAATVGIDWFFRKEG